MSKLDRRKFLFGTAGVALALPFLESWSGRGLKAQAAGAAGTGPKRIIIMAYPMGLAAPHWNPAADFSLPFTTAPLEAIKHKCVFVSGADNDVHRVAGNSYVYGHPAKKETALTGSLPVDAFPSTNANRVDEVNSNATATNGSPSNSESIENFVGRHIRSGEPRASIDLGVHSRDRSADSPYTSNFFFEARATPVSMRHNPKAAFDELFAGISPDGPSPEQLAMQARRQSVLDAVQDNFQHVRNRVSRGDQLRLDEHAAHIRELELAVQNPAVACSPPSGFEEEGTFSELYGTPGLNDVLPLQIRNLVNAMACGLAPVGRLEVLDGHAPRFGLPEVDGAVQDGYNWHSMVHGDVNPSTGMGARPGDHGEGYYAPELLAGYRFFVQQYADLITQLDAIPDADGQTMLDTSLVVLASDFGNGRGHRSSDLGFILAGNTRGGALGQHINAKDVGGSVYNANHVLTSIANIFGIEDESGQPVSEFGLKGFASGGLPGLCG